MPKQNQKSVITERETGQSVWCQKVVLTDRVTLFLQLQTAEDHSLTNYLRKLVAFWD